MTGGVERTTVDVTQALVAAGCVALVASAGGVMMYEVERAGGRHITLPLDSKSPWRIWKNARALQDIIEREGVDIVQARSRAPAWSAYLAARRTGRRFVTTFAGIYNFSGRIKRFYNSIMARGDLVIANSQFTGHHVLEQYRIPATRLRVIPRGVDLVRFDPAIVRPERLIQQATTWRLEDGLPVILLPGRVTRWKGHGLLIRALAKIKDRPFQCLMVGSDLGKEEYRKEMETLALALDLGGRVRFVGECKDMPAAYMLGDIVVSASTDPEAFGRVAAEAAAMGRPVIASDHGGARETVLPGQSGWLTAPNNVDALAAALAEALDLSPEQRAAMGAAGQAHIRAHFSKDGMCAATLAVYDEVLQGLPE